MMHSDDWDSRVKTETVSPESEVAVVFRLWALAAPAQSKSSFAGKPQVLDRLPGEGDEPVHDLNRGKPTSQVRSLEVNLGV